MESLATLVGSVVGLVLGLLVSAFLLVLMFWPVFVAAGVFLIAWRLRRPTAPPAAAPPSVDGPAGDVLLR